VRASIFQGGCQKSAEARSALRYRLGATIK
jgi:hypothetical protein